MLGKLQSDLAFTFFKHVEEHDGKLGGVAYRLEDDVPILTSVPAYMICTVDAAVG